MTGPVVGDKLALRLTGGYKNADGYLDDITQGDETVNDRNRYTLRGQGLFEGDNVSVRFIADYGSFDENCCAAITTNLDDGAGGWGPRSAALALGRQVPSTNINDLEVNITDDIPQFTKLETYGGSVEVNAEIGENLNLVSITSYRSFESDGQRGDAVALDIQRQTEELLESTTFTQELRLEGRNEFGPVGLNWLAGTFLISDQLDYAFGLQTGEDFEEFIRFVAGAPVGGALTLEAITGNTTAELASELAAGQGSSDNYSQDTLGLGLFGHTEIDLPAGFGVTLGLRWSRDEKDGRGDIDGYEVTGGNTLGDFCSTFQGDYTAALAGAPFFLPPPAAGGLGFLANLNACFPAFLAGNGFGFPDYAGELNEEEITGDAKISWSIDDVVPGVESLLLYGSYSRGFKSGGFNLDHSAAVSDPTFDKEVVNAYEIGVKTSVLGGRGVIKAAWFYNDVENFQQLAFNGSAFTVFNVPRVVNRGAEVEIQASPLDGLHVNFALQYNDAFYPANQEVDPVVANLPGRDLVHAPEFVYVAGVGYGNEIPGTGLSAFARADYRYETDHFTTSAPGSFVENRQTVNARVGLGGPDGLWTVEFWGKNIFNDITERLIIPAFGQPANFASGNSAAWIDPPRTFGGTVRGRF